MAKNTFQIAAVQASPVFMDREATIEKTCRLIAEAAENGARLLMFQEIFIPAYPDWIWHIPSGQIALNQELFGELLDQAVSIPGATTDRLCQTARDAGVYVSIGDNERNDNASGGII
jgi:predicted amidohydrolase